LFFVTNAHFPSAIVMIGDEVVGVFEHHPEAEPAYSLVQWRKPNWENRTID
jgi:proteasome lid subunit RPN8/RPN11